MKSVKCLVRYYKDDLQENLLMRSIGIECEVSLSKICGQFIVIMVTTIHLYMTTAQERPMGVSLIYYLKVPRCITLRLGSNPDFRRIWWIK